MTNPLIRPSGTFSPARGGEGKNIREAASYHPSEARMLTLLAVSAMLFVGAIVLGVFTVAVTALKVTLKLVLLPLKLLFIPLIAIVVVLKVVALLVAGIFVAAILIPIAIVIGLAALPFVIAATVS